MVSLYRTLDSDSWLAVEQRVASSRTYLLHLRFYIDEDLLQPFQSHFQHLVVFNEKGLLPLAAGELLIFLLQLGGLLRLAAGELLIFLLQLGGLLRLAAGELLIFLLQLGGLPCGYAFCNRLRVFKSPDSRYWSSPWPNSSASFAAGTSSIADMLLHPLTTKQHRSHKHHRVIVLVMLFPFCGLSDSCCS